MTYQSKKGCRVRISNCENEAKPGALPKHQAIEYIASLLSSLEDMAEKRGEGRLAHFIRLAEAEARFLLK
jgi:hypothetical protein